MSNFATPHSPPTRLVTGLIAAALLGTTPLQLVHAGTVRYYDAASLPSPDVVASILGKSAAPSRMKMRGAPPPIDEPAAQAPIAATDGGRNVEDDPIAREQALSRAAQAAVQGWNNRFATAAAAAPTSTERPSATRPAAARVSRAAGRSPTALAVAVNFDNDSAHLQPSAAPMLDAVADGLRRAGFARTYVIEGHTNATGSLAHNLRLSVERARSVKRYLVQQQGIPAAALRTVGLGPRVPLNTTDPAAPENRRVQFRAG
jgi:outer membrane protein OmpA-like peptidoglycan-associated protein